MVNQKKKAFNNNQSHIAGAASWNRSPKKNKDRGFMITTYYNSKQDKSAFNTEVNITSCIPLPPIIL